MSLPGFLSDVQVSLRKLSKAPGFSATAVLMLAFAIGATTAMFSIVDAVLLRPLPFPDGDRLVTLGDQVSGTDWGLEDPGPVTGPEVVTYPRETHSFSSLGGYGATELELSGVGEPVRIHATRMTPSVFTALGVSPELGRVFTRQEDQQKAPVAVLSYATWQARFQGERSILGARILLDRKPYVVIGVMPPAFEFPLNPGHLDRSELWVPMSFSANEVAAEAASSWYLEMIGRLKPGVTAAQAQADASLVAQQIMRNYPPDAANFRIRPVVYPLQQITGVQTRPMLRMLFLAVVVVLLIACANLTGLLLVRAMRERRETAVRLAVGAPALRLLRQVMLESLVLSMAGGLLGLGLAALALAAGRNFLPETLPRIHEISLNWEVAAFSLLLACATGLLCGLAPGLAALRTNVNGVLKEGGRAGSAAAGTARIRSLLVVGEIAVALVLLAASGLLLRSFRRMSTVDLGFHPQQATTALYSLPRQRYPTQAAVDGFNRKVLQQLRQLPGVSAAGLSSVLPGTGGGLEAFVLEGYVDARGPDQTEAAPSEVDGDFFRALGIPLLRGRIFDDGDRAGSRLVAMVNREFAAHYWPGESPVGKRMRIGTLKAGTPWITIVGEVADAKLTAPDADAAQQFYLPVAQVGEAERPFASAASLHGNHEYLVVRSTLPAPPAEPAIRAAVRSVDGQLPLTQLQTMEAVVAESEGPRRFNTVLVSAFALAAVALALLGIYSVLAFSVASRVHEMAIRMALGAQRADLVRLVLFSSLKLAGAGCVLGVAGATAASGILRGLLFNVSPFDPAVLLATSGVVMGLSVLAAALPARRAGLVDPLRVLRGE